MKKIVGLLVLAAMGAAVAALPALSQGGAPALYTAAQATAGAAVYSQNCALCHGGALEGSAAPALKGEIFKQLADAQKLTPASLLAIISQSMPQGAGGSLTADQYRQVTAYILQNNGYPAGANEFTADNACTACADPLKLGAAPAVVAQAARPAAPAAGGAIEHGNDAAPAPGAAAAAAPAAAPAGPPAAPPVPETVTIKAIEANVTVTDAQLKNTANDLDNWLLFGRTYDNARYSPLNQINTTNVKKLRPAAIIQTGVQASLQSSPMVVNGIMYVSTASNHVQAYDAVTGRILWHYTAKLTYSMICCGPMNRGVAVAYGKVFLAQLDGRVVALDARTGKLIWKTDPATTLPENPTFYTFTMAPQVYEGKVIVGNSGGEYPTRGFVQALDQETGKLIWRFHTTAAPDEPGGKGAWSGDSWKYGGGGVWNTPAVDTQRGVIAFAVGNPNPVLYGGGRLGNNLYTDSMVGVNVNTGKVVWWHQIVPHDVWDYDQAAPVVLFDADDGTGKKVPAAGEASKTGELSIVNRLTGKLLRKTAFVSLSPNMWVPPGDKPVTINPAVNGGNVWSAPAFSPETNFFYIQGIEMSWTYLFAAPIEQYKPGEPQVGQRSGGRMRGEAAATPEGAVQPSGNFTAIDVNTGKVAWKYLSPLPMQGGALATGGNLVFTGELNGDFLAFNAKTGEKLWSFNLGTGVGSPPVTYRVNGVQYIAVGASGAGSGGLTRVAANAGYIPNGNVVAIFAIPE